MLNPHIVRKEISPTSAPPEAGIHWINTLTNEEFFSVGTNSVSDWVKRSHTSTPYRQTVVISQIHLDNKKIALDRDPSFPEFTSLNFFGGIEQKYDVDFYVIGQELKWDLRGLDGFIELGDTVVIQY